MRWALAITGPTASGKTALSIELAKMLGAHIVCLDSMQIYKEMDIGTAKPTLEERAAVPHHLVDFLPFYESYSAQNYKADALSAIDAILSHGAVPMLVGGTGLYIDTLTARGENLAPESDRDIINERLAGIKTKEDAHLLWKKLSDVDPESAEAIHENNVKRVLRALEIYEKSGKTKTYFDKLSREKTPALQICMITLDYHSRDLLYSRVDERVLQMMKDGLLGETKRLADKGLFNGELTAAQAIGYKEIGEYLLGKCSLSEAVENLKTATRRYAKRQLTWFKHERDAYRLYMDSPDGKMRSPEEITTEALEFFGEFIKNKIQEGTKHEIIRT